MKTREEVALELARKCVANENPVLSSDDLLAIVDDSKRFSVWSPSTVYGYGDRVCALTFNGREYTCIEPGTSGATEPTWSKAIKGYFTREVDGPVWQDTGACYTQPYDIVRACYRAWLLKAERVANQVNAEDGDVKVELGSLYEHCMKMAHQYQPMRWY